MERAPELVRVSRRQAIYVLTQVACAGPALAALDGVPLVAAPRVQLTAAFRPQFFSPEQMNVLSVLSELIIPADEHSPGAAAARVAEFMDEIVAAGPESVQQLWTEGLAALDAMAAADHGKRFLDCDEPEQVQLLTVLSRDEEAPATAGERFFVAAKRATVDGYYNSAIGIHEDLNYQGNTYLASFPGCEAERLGPDD